MGQIVVQYDVTSTAVQYNNVIRDLASAGLDHPKGRIYHIAVQKGKKMEIIGIWESENAFKDFNKTLMPTLEKNGIKVSKPTLLPVYNILH